MARRSRIRPGQAVARSRYVRMSATKARFMLDQIRGRHVEDAKRVLQFTPRSAAREISKILDAAIANAENALRASSEDLYVTRAWADEGPTLKRWMPRAQGRATRIRKRMCHINVVVEPRRSGGGTED
jgi:large subunit ribosomal protein L22